MKLLLSAVSLAGVRALWELAQGLGVLALLSGATQRAAGVAGVVWWTGELAWSVLLDAWSCFVWDTSLTPKVLFSGLTTFLFWREKSWPARYCGLTLTMPQLLLTSGGVSTLGFLMIAFLLYTAAPNWVAGRLPSSLRAGWWGVCVWCWRLPQCW